jgi:hypothetical protein
MSHMAEVWLEYHVDDCEYCANGGDPHKCKRWLDEQDRHDAIAEMLYDSIREEGMYGNDETEVSGRAAVPGGEAAAS